MILTDPKGELYEETAELLKAEGYNIRTTIDKPNKSAGLQCDSDHNASRFFYSPSRN